MHWLNLSTVWITVVAKDQISCSRTVASTRSTMKNPTSHLGIKANSRIRRDNLLLLLPKLLSSSLSPFNHPQVLPPSTTETSNTRPDNPEILSPSKTLSSKRRHLSVNSIHILNANDQRTQRPYTSQRHRENRIEKRQESQRVQSLPTLTVHNFNPSTINSHRENHSHALLPLPNHYHTLERNEKLCTSARPPRMIKR